MLREFLFVSEAWILDPDVAGVLPRLKHGNGNGRPVSKAAISDAHAYTGIMQPQRPRSSPEGCTFSADVMSLLMHRHHGVGNTTLGWRFPFVVGFPM